MRAAAMSVSLRREFRILRVAMQSLDRTLQRLSENGATSGASGRPRREIRVTPSRRAALVLQGRYMGYMRQLKPRQKAQVRKVKEAKGIRAAIERAEGLAVRRRIA